MDLNIKFRMLDNFDLWQYYSEFFWNPVPQKLLSQTVDIFPKSSGLKLPQIQDMFIITQSIEEPADSQASVKR